MVYIVPQLFFYNDGFGIKIPTKVDVHLTKETNPNNNFIHSMNL